MYDMWYTTGVAVIRPALLDAIQNAKPVFNFVDRFIIEVEDGNQTLIPKAPRTGLLEPDPTTRVRQAIAKFVKNFSAAAPPIGIYTAGRFSQYAAIPNFSSARPNDSKISDIMAIANQGYKKAVGMGAESADPTFPAFLGLCMMDGALAHKLGTPTPEQVEVATEFGIPADPANRSWQIATNFVQTIEFGTATQLFMLSDLDPWTVCTEEQIFFWKGLNERAIP